MGSAPQVREVGPIYDVLLSTRDGSTLPCINAQGQVRQLSSVAFMGSIDRNQLQHEETELQHKDQLVQLGSSNIIDRELTNWPQATQGDWTGGTFQRVFSGPNSDPTRYWEGDGVLWPLNDYLPQRGAQFAPIRDENGAVMIGNAFVGTPAGSINSIGMSYAYLYRTTVGTIQTNLVIINGDTRYTVVNPSGISTGNGTPSAPAATAEFMIGNGVLWYGNQNGANFEIRFVTVGTPTVTLFDTIAGATSMGNNAWSVGYVGNRVYLAVPYLSNSTPTERIRLYEIENGVSTAFIDLNLGDTTTVLGSSGQVNVTSTVFSGDTLYYTGQNGSGDAFIVAYSLVSSTFSTVAMLPGEGALFLTQVAGTIFIVSSGGNMYLLQGGSLQHIGPLPPQIGPVAVSPGVDNIAFINSNSLSHPVTFGPYAVFSAVYYPLGTAISILATFAFDVLRGRLFRIATTPNLPRQVPTALGARIGLLTGSSRTLVPGTVVTPLWSVVVPATALLQDSLSTAGAQLIDVGVRRTNLQTAQLGFGAILSLFDFTSAQPKLFRDVVANFLALTASPACRVRLDVWLNQDPANLSTAPDFTASIAGDTSPGAEVLRIRINQIATKLVVRVQTFGGADTTGVTTDVAGNIVNAPKLVSTIVRVATGWVQTLQLDLAPQLQSNSKNVQDIWTYQGIDSTAAYNFLRQLWRLEGGQCLATFPNGDTGPWQMEDAHFDSPKPFGVSFRADQASGLKYTTSLKIREDID